MDFNTTIDIIIKDLREAREIIDDFKNYPGVPELQVELAKSKCKSAEEIIALLKTIKASSPPKKSEKTLQSAPKEKQKEQIPEQKESEIASGKSQLSSSSGSASKTDLFEISEDDDSDVAAEKPVLTGKDKSKKLEKKEEEPVETGTPIWSKSVDKTSESNIIADKFSGGTSTLHEQFGATKGEEDISSKHKSLPVDDLGEAIGVNDKFHFIREIFNGNQASYLEAIAKLNEAESMADAKAIIMSYTGDSQENEAIKQLLDLVKRKLGSDE